MTTRVLVAQGVGERLIELADRLGADLIAVGSQRPRATERLLLGSVADKVVRGASQPVLVVPAQMRPAPGTTGTARRRGGKAAGPVGPHSHAAFTGRSWKHR